MNETSRNAVVTVLFVCLTIVGVAMVASTVTSVVAVDTVLWSNENSPSIIGPEVPGTSFLTFNGDGLPATTLDGSPAPPIPVMCIEFLQTWPAIVGILAGMVTTLYVVSLRFDLASAGLFATFLIPVVMLAYFLLTNCAGGGWNGDGPQPPIPPEPPGDPGWITLPESPLIAAAVFGGLVLLGVVMLVTMTREDEHVEHLEEEEIPEVDAAQFARAAGAAADRIEAANVPVDNAVYRAWLQMTGLLDIGNPDTAAPRTFAEAAIDVGLAEVDVRELTKLFNEVRYGGRDPDTREERALEILRNVEETYRADTTGKEPDRPAGTGEEPD